MHSQQWYVWKKIIDWNKYLEKDIEKPLLLGVKNLI